MPNIMVHYTTSAYSGNVPDRAWLIWGRARTIRGLARVWNAAWDCTHPQPYAQGGNLRVMVDGRPGLLPLAIHALGYAVVVARSRLDLRDLEYKGSPEAARQYERELAEDISRNV